MSITGTFGYRSPLSKLVDFFRRSRDRWKAKCKAAKQENKSLKIRLAKVTESRNRWKSKAQGVEQDAERSASKAQPETKNRGQ